MEKFVCIYLQFYTLLLSSADDEDRRTFYIRENVSKAAACILMKT